MNSRRDNGKYSYQGISIPKNAFDNSTSLKAIQNG